MSSPVKMTLASDLPAEPDYPLFGSFKYDGVRASYQDATWYQRSLKPVVNDFIQSHKCDAIEGFDGELVVGKPNEEATFRRTTGAVRRKKGEPDFKFYVFDTVQHSGDLELRQSFLNTCKAVFEFPEWVEIIKQRVINNKEELDAMVKEALDLGYEGLVVRKPALDYKHGRSTKKQQHLMRIVPWEKAEAIVIGFEEGRHNTNEAKKNELGRTSRSTNAENMIPNGLLGAFLCRNLSDGVEFKVGNGDGMTDELRKEIYENQDNYLNQIITYRHKTVGGYDKPRQAQYVGIRSPDDMGGE